MSRDERHAALREEGIKPEREQVEATLAAFSIVHNGTYSVSCDTEYDIPDGVFVHVQIGGFSVCLDEQGGWQLLYNLIEELVGEGYAAPLIALMQRMPEQDVCCGPFAYDNGMGEDERGAVRALWNAAWQFRHLWPQRLNGFDDRLWGVTPPEGVEVQRLGKEYVQPPRPAAFAQFLDPKLRKLKKERP